MAKKETTNHAAPVLPMLKTVEQMSKVSGIGENKLRELMDNGELEYVQNGNRRLIACQSFSPLLAKKDSFSSVNCCFSLSDNSVLSCR